MAIILDLQHAKTYDSIPSSLSVLPDPGNMGVTVGISLLLCVYAEMCATEFSKPSSWIYDFSLLNRSFYHFSNTSRVSAQEFSGVSVKMSFLASVE